MKNMMMASALAILAAAPVLAADPPLPDLTYAGKVGILDAWSVPEGQPRIGTVYTSESLPGLMVIGQALDLSGNPVGPSAMELPAENPADAAGVPGVNAPVLPLPGAEEVVISETERAALDELVLIIDGSTAPEEFQARVAKWREEWRPRLEETGSATVTALNVPGETPPAAAAVPPLAPPPGPAPLPPAYPANPGDSQALDRLRQVLGGSVGAPPAAQAAPAPAATPAEPVEAATAAAPAPAQAAPAAAADPQQVLETVLADIEAEAFWFSMGRPDAARTAYMFMDPECPYCARSIDSLKGAIERGEIQLRLIPVPLVSQASPDAIAGMLVAPDPVAEAFAHARGKLMGDRTPPAATFADLPEEFRNLVAHNLEIVRRHGVPGVPLFVFRTADGKIGLHSGQGSMTDLDKAAQLPPAVSRAAEAAMKAAMEKAAEDHEGAEAPETPAQAPAE